MTTPHFMVVLVGIPAAGKSQLAVALSSGAAGAWLGQCFLPTHVEFDRILEDVQARHGNAFSHDIWQESRHEFHRIVQEVASIQSQARFMIVDDTMHLRSMRKRCCQIAEQQQCAYAQIYLPCELEIAMQRNDARATEVSRETICKIAGELESPLAYGSRYDRATLVYRAGSLIEDLGAALEQIYADFTSSSHSPKPSTDVASTSLVHTYDLQCRSTITETLTSYEGEKAQLAARLNKERKARLAELKLASEVGEMEANLWSESFREWVKQQL